MNSYIKFKIQSFYSKILLMTIFGLLGQGLMGCTHRTKKNCSRKIPCRANKLSPGCAHNVMALMQWGVDELLHFCRKSLFPEISPMEEWCEQS